MAKKSAQSEKPPKPRITPGNAKRALGVAKVVGPALLPVAMQAAAAARERWDRAKAHRLGVDVSQLSEFTGRGATLHAQIAALTRSLRELRDSHPEHADFVTTSERRLTDLAAAVRAAEQMPASRRRAAHQAVAAELDALGSETLQRFGVRAQQPPAQQPPAQQTPGQQPPAQQAPGQQPQ